jgi:hypothetical protein
MSTDTTVPDRQIGWLCHGRGFFVVCLACIPRSMGVVLGWTPLYAINVGQYRQPCVHCGAEVGGTWPVVLFDGQPS